MGAFTIEQAARFYRIPLIDYSRGRGVLISSGCGLMLAVMDQAPFRWCVDTDRLSAAEQDRLADFCTIASALEPIAVCGWFSYSRPAPLIAAVRACSTPLSYAGHIRFGVDGEHESLESFLYACKVACADET